MPVINGVGQSQNTKIKLTQLPMIFDYHIAITSTVIKKHFYYDRDYLYIDATSGPGIYENISDLGSPLSFANAVNNKSISYKAIFIDESEYTLLKLRENIPSNFKCDIWTGEYQTLIPQILNGVSKKQLGLVYIDPNNDPNLETVKYIASHRPRMEILLYVSGANMKRIGKSIADYSVNTQKECWIIRKPQDKHQWTFMMGTNFNFKNTFTKIGMYSIDSPQGEAYFNKLALTHEEQKNKMQIPLIADMTYRNYKEYLKHPKFLEIRKHVMERANGICERCKKEMATQVHHLKYPKWGTFDIPENLIAVCYLCHCEIHGVEK